MITTLTVILAVAAGQAAEHAAPATPPSAKQAAPKGAAEPSAEELLPPEYRLVREGSPILRWGVQSRCVVRGEVVYRAQCDEKTGRCLVAPDAELSDDAVARSRLERAPECAGPPLALEDLTSRGYHVVPALAEAQPGWTRDERQRAMQFDFDLNARYYLGGGGIAASSGPWTLGGVVAGGGRFDHPFTWWDAPALLRMHFLEGWAGSDGKHGELLVFGIDASRIYPTPLLRLTTFVGKPRRYDLPLNFGLWAEGIRMEFLKDSAGKTYDRTMFVNGAVTLDLFRSRDLSDFVRVRGGAGVEQSRGGDWVSIVSHAALESEVTLGSTGSHKIRVTALGERLGDSGEKLDPALPTQRNRLTGTAEYELVLFAINDQPITLALQAKAQKRDDVPGYPADWIRYAGAQLRFNLWAPPRRNAKLQDSL